METSTIKPLNQYEPNKNHYINMNKSCFAQDAILKRIKEKSDWKENFQDYQEHTDYDAYSDYNDCHGDYYDNEVAY